MAPRQKPDPYERYCRRLGQRIAELRRERGLTQHDMVTLGFDVRRYQRVEAGAPVTMRTIWRIAQALEVTVEDLVAGAE